MPETMSGSKSNAGNAAEELFRDEARLTAERRRLVALCARQLDGDRTLAEDVAQEALTLAWQARTRLREPNAYQAWLSGIARNLCLRRHATRARERQRFQSLSALSSPFGDESPIAGESPDPYALLEQAERADLLDRALDTLPRATHGLLIDRYIHELPLSEIAARRGIREETATVQLFRSRAALKRALIAPALRPEAVALGVVPRADAEQAEWQETRLWCPECGVRHLVARFVVSDAETVFHLRCPACDPDAQPWKSLCYGLFKPDSRTFPLLDGVSAIRPAYNRLTRWWNDFAESATVHGQVGCFHCGAPMTMKVSQPSASYPDEEPAISTLCAHCKRHCYVGLGDRCFVLPQAQAFWGDHPRLRRMRHRAIATNDGPAYLSRLESVTTGRALEIVSDARTLRIREIQRV